MLAKATSGLRVHASSVAPSGSRSAGAVRSLRLSGPRTALRSNDRSASKNSAGQNHSPTGRVMGSGSDVEIETSDSQPWAEPGYMGAAVSSMPESTQAGVVAGIFAALGAGTAISCSIIGPAIEHAIPDLFAFSKATWPLLGVTYVAAGVAHFSLEKGFLDMYPHRGAWGIYALPGSPRFHVQWTGQAVLHCWCMLHFTNRESGRCRNRCAG